METIPTQRLKDLFNTPDEISAIKSICRQVLTSLNLPTAPVPLKPICNKFNLKVNYNNAYKKEDSFLKLSPNGFEIEISKQKNWRRNRFTIAHELCHLILFNAIDIPINSNDISQHKEIERLCDIGASELLMNEDELENSLRNTGINSEALKALYDRFMVSYDALFMKLSEFLNANIIIWKNHSRHELEGKEFRVYKHFPKYNPADKSIWLPNGCTVKHISPNPFKYSLGEVDGRNIILDDFSLIMNDRITSCSAITLMFPHSRALHNILPIFDHLVIRDESIYDDCLVMFIFKDKTKFKKIKEKYLKDGA